MEHPSTVTACNLDLENLISDSNRSVATLAITTLLKTGAEASVDRLMKQIATFVNEISDEFKIVVVQVIIIYFIIYKFLYLTTIFKYSGYKGIMFKIPSQTHGFNELFVWNAKRRRWTRIQSINS